MEFEPAEEELCINGDLDFSIIKKQKRKIAILHHPDKPGVRRPPSLPPPAARRTPLTMVSWPLLLLSQGSTEKMADINTAFEKLEAVHRKREGKGKADEDSGYAEEDDASARKAKRKRRTSGG